MGKAPCIKLATGSLQPGCLRCVWERGGREVSGALLSSLKKLPLYNWYEGASSILPPSLASHLRTTGPRVFELGSLFSKCPGGSGQRHQKEARGAVHEVGASEGCIIRAFRNEPG